MSQVRPAFYVDTSVLVSLFHNDSGYPAAEAWLMRVAHCIGRCLRRL